MKKTFREVVATIRNGERWRSNDIEIFKYKNDISIRWFEDGKCGDILIFENELFELKRQNYTFQEAYMSLKEGKEIENYKGTRFKIVDNKYCFWSDFYGSWEDVLDEALAFSIEEIDNPWYINED